MLKFFFLGSIAGFLLVSNVSLAAKQKIEATSFDASFNATENDVTVSFTFENKTSKPMYMTDDGSPEVKSVRFEPTETCVLVSKLKKPAAGQPEIPVKATRVMPGKKYSSTMKWSLPLHHDGEIPKGWSKEDKPICKTLRFEIAAIPGYSDLNPTENPEAGKKYYLLSKEARRHQETQSTSDAEGFEIPVLLE